MYKLTIYNSEDNNLIKFELTEEQLALFDQLFHEGFIKADEIVLEYTEIKFKKLIDN